MTSTLEARHVSKSFVADGAPVDALHDVSMTIDAGEYVAITGPSGSGKSTLLHLFAALTAPTSGSVLIDGDDLATLSRTELAGVRNRRLGVVFQFFNLLPALTVEENVTLPAIIGGLRQASYRDRLGHLLEVVGLQDKRSRLPSQLSGGEQQRVAIARGLIMTPSVLLADEPTGNLDSRSGGDVLDLLGRCHADGQTIVLVTHDMRVATRTDRVVFLRDGEIADEATLEASERPVSRMIQLGDEDE
jgi:putative ABC transport system ATP-binding protein